MRLIDADELKKALAEMWYERNIRITGLSVAKLIDDAPTIEPNGDLISKEGVIKHFENLYSCGVRELKLDKIEEELNALPSADRPTPKQTDTMIIADALRYLVKDTERHELDRTRAEELREQILQYGASMCSSAERPTVIRSKTLMPTKDFMEWAKRVKETNPNVIVIPCDAEDVSADRPKGEWIRKEDNVSWWVECSRCGEKPLLDVYSHTYEKTSYCPCCGAEMK